MHLPYTTIKLGNCIACWLVYARSRSWKKVRLPCDFPGSRTLTQLLITSLYYLICQEKVNLFMKSRSQKGSRLHTTIMLMISLYYFSRIFNLQGTLTVACWPVFEVTVKFILPYTILHSIELAGNICHNIVTSVWGLTRGWASCFSLTTVQWYHYPLSEVEDLNFASLASQKWDIWMQWYFFYARR